MMDQESARRVIAETISKELRKRTMRNPKYSLRSFARDLGVSPATLSNVIASKQALSSQLAKKVVKELTLPESMRAHFETLAAFTSARSDKQKQDLGKELKIKYKSDQAELDLEAFEIIQNPWHFAVLEALKLPALNNDSKQAFEFLGIPIRTGIEILTRLQNVGLVEKKNKQFFATKSSNYVFPAATSQAVQNFHAAILALAKASLPQDLDSRFFLSLLTAASSKKRKEIEKRLVDFFKTIETEIEEDSAPKDEVIAIGFYNFTLMKRKKSHAL